MLYSLVRPLVKIGLQVLYRKIDIAHADRIPKGKAVILAANHPTAFIEPCILACFLDRPLHFLARGDLFKKPLFIKILRALHILPVFRLRDGGYGKLKRNYETFETCYKALKEHKTIMVLAEGRCIHEKKLRPLRKGTARIALGALSENPDLKEVYVVPIGVNFTYADRSRSSVLISCNEPILASEYFDIYQDKPQQAIHQLTNDLRDKLIQDVIHIPNTADELPAEYLFRILRSQQNRPRFPIVSSTEKQLRAEKKIADDLFSLEEADKKWLRENLSLYFGRLHWASISDAALAGNYKKDQKRLSPFFYLFLGLPVFFWHLPPLYIGQFIADTKVKEMEFYIPVKAAAWIIAYLLYSIFWLTLGIITQEYWLILMPPILCAAGFFLIMQMEIATHWLQAWRTRRQIPQELELLRSLRKELINRMKAYQWI